MNKIKSLIVFLMIGGLSVQCFATNFYNPQDRSFKAGFEAGLKALEFQKKNEGVQSKEITINDAYYLSLNIKNMPLPEVLFLQNISAREGFESYLTKNYLIFVGYERKADAIEAQQRLLHHYKIETSIVYSKDNKLITYPILWGEFYTNFLNEVAERGYAIRVDVIEIPKIITKIRYVENNKPKVTQIIKGSLINLKAMSYSLSGSKNLSKNYSEKGFLSKQEFSLESSEPIITASGERFYKVKDRNVYFSAKDMRIIR